MCVAVEIYTFNRIDRWNYINLTEKWKLNQIQYWSLKFLYIFFRENRHQYSEPIIGVADVKNHYGEEPFLNTTTHISSQKVITISKLHWAEFPANKCDNTELYES